LQRFEFALTLLYGQPIGGAAGMYQMKIRETPKRRHSFLAAFLLFAINAFAAQALAGGGVVDENSTATEVAPRCSDDIVWLRGDWGTARFRVEIADDPEEQRIGLMNRQSLARSAGMLFIYPEARPASFWMANTLIPLDMLFFDSRGNLVTVHENAVPLDRSALFGGDAVKAVLEINGGMARALGILSAQGDSPMITGIAHPSFDTEDAVYPCPSPR